jgi:multiple sugar transport system permease protein
MILASDNRSNRIVIYVLSVLVSFMFLFPLYLAIVNSLGSVSDPPSILPLSLHWENYRLATTMMDGFWNYAKNSVILCAIVVTTSTLSSGIVGYAFARIPAPGRNIWFMLVLSLMMMPAIVTQIPTYILFHKYGMLDTFLPWLLWGIGGGVGGASAYFIFFYRQYFASIPKEIEEAACMDGCSIFRTYWNIFLPMSLPVVVTVAILNFQWTWSNDAVTPFFFLKQGHYPLVTALANMPYTPLNSKIVLEQVATAAGILYMIPALLVFFLGQKYIVEGIVTTGIKG